MALDVAIIGAGPAGIAAGRALSARGLSVHLFEARNRIGGRAQTVMMAGRPVDLGAHWLHAAPINPVVALAEQAGIRLKRAPLDAHLVINGKAQDAAMLGAYWRAYGRADAAISDAAQAGGPDQPASARLPVLGMWRRPVSAITGLVCGRPLEEVSAQDFASAEYADNLFAPMGFGALVTWLGRSLPVSLGVAARRISQNRSGLEIDTTAGQISARAVIIAAPPLVLQQGGLEFDPPLPADHRDALMAFRPGIYEHAILRWPSAPFWGADRLATLIGPRHDGVGLLTRLDGSSLHYLELDEPARRACVGSVDKARLWARALLRGQFGSRAIADLAVLHVTDWADDRWSRGSWSTLPPGFAGARDALAAPLGAPLAFAGEWASHDQWGTVGGAWVSGEQAAERIAAQLAA